MATRAALLGAGASESEEEEDEPLELPVRIPVLLGLSTQSPTFPLLLFPLCRTRAGARQRSYYSECSRHHEEAGGRRLPAGDTAAGHRASAEWKGHEVCAFGVAG